MSYKGCFHTCCSIGCLPKLPRLSSLFLPSFVVISNIFIVFTFHTKKTAVMSKRIFLPLLLLFCFQSFAQRIVILYDNDVHCNLDGYAKLAHLKRSELKSTDYVAVVSCGDFVAGASLGAVSKGDYVVRVMNSVGYDFVTLGNHEFDYKVPRLLDLSARLSAQVLCCNFAKIGAGFPFAGFALARFDDVDVAFIGVTTPSTPTSSTPTYFMDDQGRMRYSFCPDSLSSRVQHMVNLARAQGAQYVIVLSHLGDEGEAFTSLDLIASTSGIDVLLDGHSHNVIPARLVPNKLGRQVLLSSTGAHFQNVGRLVISPDAKTPVSTELIPLASYQGIDSAVAMVVGGIREEYDLLGRRLLGSSSVRLFAKDDRGLRLPRFQESNLGDFAADALRSVLGSDIAWVNGGSLRSDLLPGPLSFNDVYSLFPFGNQVSVVRVSGQQLLDNLEVGARLLSNDNGAFVQTSGLSYLIDTTVASSVVFDSNGILSSVGPHRRVHHVRVLDRLSGRYLPLDPSESYSLASFNYLLFDHGNGFNFDGASSLVRDSLSDLELLESHLASIGGVIDSSYALPKGRIAFAPCPQRPSQGYWKAVIPDVDLPVNLRLAPVAPDSLAWSFLSPSQTDKAFPASSAVWNDDTLILQQKSIGIRLSLVYQPASACLVGSFRQGSLRTPISFVPSDTLWTFLRPQTPVPPFPYAEQTIAVSRKDKHGRTIHLEGTLSFPDDGLRHPAVLLVSGSGQQNRDEEIFGHRPFLVLADYLTRQGFAVLRYDDRGVGASSGDVASATTFDFADDAEALFQALRRNEHVLPRRIAIAGHSEGGAIAPLVASRNRKVAAVVMLAGQGASGSDVLISQNAEIFARRGVSPELISVRLRFLSLLFSMVDTIPPQRIYPQALALSSQLCASLSPSQIDSIQLSPMALLALSQQLSLPWYRSFLSLQPLQYLPRVHCPVLALNGALDCQVPPQNLNLISHILARAGTPCRTVCYPSLNHLFQHCQTGSTSEYIFIPETFAPEALADIASFLHSSLAPTSRSKPRK